MIHDSQFDTVPEQLRAALAAGALAAPAAARANDLLSRLETPVRVALIGPEDAGRIEALAAILGTRVPPVHDLPADRPTLELVWGQTAATAVRFADGTEEARGSLADALADPEAVMVSHALPEPMLKRIQVIDIATDPEPEVLLAALGWAARRADVFVWWSSRFERAEREAWRAAPPRLRDHGFLVLWNADAVASGPRHPGPAAEDFLQVIQAGRDTADAPQAGAGLHALAVQLARHVELARQADTDAALLFLQKHVRPDSPSPSSRPRSAPVEGAESVAHKAAQTAAQTAAQIRSAVGRSMAAPLPRAPSRPRRNDTPEPPAGTAASEAQTLAAVAQEPPTHSSEAAAGLARYCRQAAALIRARARAMRRLDLSGRGRAAPPILTSCTATVQDLTERLDALPDPVRLAADDIATLLATAEETLILLEVEGAGAADTDAICLLHQLGREFTWRSDIRDF